MKSSLSLSTNTPISDKTLPKLKTIWKSLQSHNDSGQFRNPLDYKAMELFDYPLYVTHPMDLSTIHRKLREGRYRLVEEVLDDFQLIWDNCKIYNPTSSWIFGVAQRLQRSFKKMVEFYLPSIPIMSSFDDKKQDNHMQEIEKHPLEEEVPFHSKTQFVQKLRLLNPPQLKTITDSIQECCPNAFTQSEGKAQILIDLLDWNAFNIVNVKLQQIMLTERISCKKMKLL